MMVCVYLFKLLVVLRLQISFFLIYRLLDGVSLYGRECQLRRFDIIKRNIVFLKIFMHIFPLLQ